MERQLRCRLDAIIALLILITAGVLGIALDGGALWEAAAVFVVGALVVQFSRSVGLFPAYDDADQ